MRDTEIFDRIQREKERQVNGIELIASENFASPAVMEAMGSVLTNKYAEGYPGKRYYGGCEIVDEIETIAIQRAKELFGAEYANVQPHSGSQANAAVYLACMKPGDTLMGFDLAHGGHLTHGSPVNFSGKTYNVVFYGVDRETGLLNYETILETAAKERPKVIIAGASAYSRDMDYARFRQIADEVGALLLADISHPSGLIAKGLLSNAVEHSHIVTTTTHKTLRGPRGGLILMGKNFDNPFGIRLKNGKLRKMSALLDLAIFPGIQGGPLEHVVAAKAVAFREALSDSFEQYVQQVRANAQKMSQLLKDRGYDVLSGGTDNHMLLIDLRNKGITGKDAEASLELVGITANKNMVPFDTESPFITSGIRLGTPAVTTRGMKEGDMEFIVECIDQALLERKNTKALAELNRRIARRMGDFPLYQETERVGV